MTAIAPPFTKQERQAQTLNQSQNQPIFQNSNPLTDRWIRATWDEFVQILENPVYADSRCYYDKEQMRIETMPVGSEHADYNTIIIFATSLYCTLANIPARGLTNCSFSKIGFQGCQPDICYYIGAEAIADSPRNSSIVDLDKFQSPNLVIEISSSTITDDLGKKRLLYEKLGIDEYWIVDVQEVKIIALEMLANGGSRQITASKLLNGLAIADLEAALQLSRENSQSAAVAWLLQKYSGKID